jgi:hypothetical protein
MSLLTVLQWLLVPSFNALSLWLDHRINECNFRKYL